MTNNIAALRIIDTGSFFDRNLILCHVLNQAGLNANIYLPELTLNSLITQHHAIQDKVLIWFLCRKSMTGHQKQCQIKVRLK